MKKITKILIGCVAGLTALLQMPTVQAYLASVAGKNVHVSELISALAMIAALMHNPASGK